MGQRLPKEEEFQGEGDRADPGSRSTGSLSELATCSSVIIELGWTCTCSLKVRVKL